MLELKNIAIIGASGGIGQAFSDVLSAQYPNALVHAFSRTKGHRINYAQEESISKAAAFAASFGALDCIIVANGILHSQEIMPEKSLNELSREKFQQLFEANVITPALVAKYFLPHLNRDNTSIFAALSARVGSISDNQLGGWYAYRSSKAALNMIIKNASIEVKRRNKNAIVVGLHPGTVDTALSRPFQKNVNSGQILTPQESAKRLLSVIKSLLPEQSGKCFSIDGEEILP